MNESLNDRKLHLLCGHGNAAENLKKFNSYSGLNALWAGKFLLKVQAAKTWLPWQEIDEWALIEALNTGSYQRIKLPENIRECLEGSGRWEAQDRGGWYRLLMEASLRWQDASTEEQKSWERAEKTLMVYDSTVKTAVATEKKKRGE